MDDRPLGYLEPVEPASVWKSEAGEFLPWLSMPENLHRLGEALGLRLEPVAREAAAGQFRADLLCRNRDTGATVVIEAQLGLSDHRHLGQVLTYAFTLRARTVVWIATRFRAEHRGVLDQLNGSGPARLGCFAVEMDLWRIGASAAAPRFTVVVEPRERPGPDREPAAAHPPPSGETPLRARRKRASMSMRQLAAAAGISRTYLSRIEIGKCPGTPKTRAAIARALAAAGEADRPVPQT